MNGYIEAGLDIKKIAQNTTSIKTNKTLQWVSFYFTFLVMTEF